MNEYVYAEFLFEADVVMQGAGEIIALGEDFVLIKSDLEWDMETGGLNQGYQRICGKISATAATAIKLGNKFLSDRMRVSYIADDLKDKYRR